MAKKKSGSLDTGTKVVIGLVSVGLLFAVMGSEPDNDAWDGGDADDVEAIGPTGTGSDGQVPGAPEGDPWSEGAVSSGDGGSGAPADDPWTRGGAAPGGDGGEPSVPVDDPWTRGAPPSGGDTPVSLPADDPWTRGRTPSGGDGSLTLPADDPWTRGAPPSGDDGPPACVGTMAYATESGAVRLPTDRTEGSFASPECTIGAGQSGGPVLVVQVALNQCNGQLVALSGINDAATTEALAAVQARQGLRADGVYGPSTRRVMAWPTARDGGSTRCLTHQDVD